MDKKLVDRTTYAKNDRAMAATAAEFSNPRNTANGLRRVFIRWFRVVNAIAGEKVRRERRWTSAGATSARKLVRSTG
jgi:hypothetical protein